VSTNIFEVEIEHKPVVKCFMLDRYHDLAFFVIQCSGFFQSFSIAIQSELVHFSEKLMLQIEKNKIGN